MKSTDLCTVNQNIGVWTQDISRTIKMKKIMKKMNKVIAAMMIMAITTAMPAMAGNKNSKSISHFDKVDKALSHHDAHKSHTYRPEVKSCTFKVSRHENHKKFVEKVEHMKGVMDTKWNPRTREVTVIYDAKVTSARHIKHFMA